MTNAIQDLITRIDTLVAHNLRYYYKKCHGRNELGYFEGLLEASYQFAYYLIDDDTNTVQDAIDYLLDDAFYYDKKRSLFARGYFHGIMKLVETLHNFKESYEVDCDINDEHYLKHVLSLITINDFR